MAIIGVFGCTALVVCALAMHDGMEDLKTWQYETVNHYESKLTLNENATPEQIDSIMAAVHGEAVQEGSIEIRVNGVKKTGILLVMDHVTLIQPTNTQLRSIALPADGVSISMKIADTLGVRQGDTIEWHIYGVEGWTQSRIAAVYRAPAEQGLTMTRAHLESLGMTFRPTAILSAETAAAQLDGVDSVTSTAESMAGWDDLTDAMYTMVYLLIAAASVLSIVVLYNLGLLSFTEMEREMATLKVMGLKSRRLRNLLLTQNLWFSAIGFALGVPGGMQLTKVIVSMSGDSFDFPIYLHGLTLTISFVFTFGLSVLVNLLFSRKIRRLNMVESLKAME
jgi:putative ABC transport system permease protein